MASLIDPRSGDAEDDASSTKKRSLAAIAGSLLAEISLTKLVAAWFVLIVLPGILLGVAPLLVTAWIATASRQFEAFAGVLPLIALGLVAAAGWYGVRPLFRAAERSFWSLNALVVQPGYALCREGLRHLTERRFAGAVEEGARARMRSATAAAAGLVVCAVAVCIVALLWPATRWSGGIADLSAPLHLIGPALANSVVLVGVYLAVISLVWGFADAAMHQPGDLASFDDAPASARRWRIAHLSDVHAVGERYGFRIESGRAGPRGNERLAQALERLAALHAADPVDIVLFTGDMTDAGRSSEWVEFLDILLRHPALAERSLILPGNHDVNIVDRANPGRLELPTSPGRRLRQMRTLSAMAALQGDRVHVVDHAALRLGPTLSEALVPHRKAIEAFADSGTLRLSRGLGELWADAFPLVLPPDDEAGLGVVVLNSNAEANFSFTNALGFLTAEDVRALTAVLRRFPEARWLVALHHHVVEYPKPAKALSERIGTALVNGSWFVRQLDSVASRIVLMHGHRHVDWVGRCGRLKIVSAPSPVMEATNDEPTAFYIHTLAAFPEGGLALLQPERVELAGAAASSDP